MNAHTRHGCWGKKTVSSFKATNRTRRCCSLLFLRVEAERFLVALFEASVAAESHNAKKKMINPRQKHADDISKQCSHISIRMPFLVFSKAELPESFSSYRKGSLPMIDLYTVPGSDRFGSDRFGSVQISWDLSPWVLSCFFFFFFQICLITPPCDKPEAWLSGCLRKKPCRVRQLLCVISKP